VRRGLVTVLDVRPPDEYSAGHIAGAVNVPLVELEKYLKKLKPKQEVVAYCRGPHCVLSYDAVEKLRGRGFKARRLKEGYPEWQAAGLPVEV
jgi:rhodanese-related sulfurtransferase